MNEKVQIREILQKIVEKTNLDPQIIQQFLNELSSSIEEGLARDGKVRIQDLGIFSLKWHNPRTGRNIQTGEAFEIPGQYKVHFQPMKSLKQAVNHKYAHLKPVILDEIPIQEEEPVTPSEPAHPDFEIAAPVPQPNNSNFSITSEPVSSPPPATSKSSRFDKAPPAQKSIPIPVKRSSPYRRAIIGLSLLFLLLSFLVIYIYIDRFHHAQPQEPGFASENLSADSTQNQLTEKTINPIPMDSSTKDLAKVEPTNPPTSDLKTEPVNKNSLVTNAQNPDPALGVSDKLKLYRINPGDNLWDLANQYYADPYWWPYIYQSNLSDLSNPDILDIGLSLKIPLLEGNVLSPSLDEQKQLALGYFNAYLVYQQLPDRRAFPFIKQAILYDSTLLNSRRYEIAITDLQRLHLLRDQLKKEYSGK